MPPLPIGATVSSGPSLSTCHSPAVRTGLHVLRSLKLPSVALRCWAPRSYSGKWRVHNTPPSAPVGSRGAPDEALTLQRVYIEIVGRLMPRTTVTFPARVRSRKKEAEGTMIKEFMLRWATADET